MSEDVRSHRDLIVWQKAVEFVVRCYESTRTFPKEERYGLCSQMQRAAVSIPSNIAEGRGRRSSGAFINHLRIAGGSIAELDTQIEVARRLEYISDETCTKLITDLDEIGRMTTGLRLSIERQSPPS